MSTPAEPTPAAAAASPAASGSNVLELPPDHEAVSEGKATIIFSKENKVFYNPVQCFNRDLSTLMIKMFQKKRAKEIMAKEEAKRERRIARQAKLKAQAEAKGEAFEEREERPLVVPPVRILEALSATGLRSLRYWKEIDGLGSITVNDIDATAVAAIKRNVEFNKVDVNKCIPTHNDCNITMLQAKMKGEQFDVIDLDPYGTAAPFLNAAVQSVADGGLLAVTCTDKAVLCGNYSEACYGKYRSMPIRAKYCHEMAVRILLQTIEANATPYSRYIVPVLSMSIDFYVRVFVRVYTSKLQVKASASKMAYVYSCVSCESFHYQRVGKMNPHGKGFKYTQGTGPNVTQRCGQCNGVFKVGGPVYIDDMHDNDFVKDALDYVKANQGEFATSKRMIGQLTACMEELPGCPFYYTIGTLCRTIHVSSPKTSVITSALLNAGYKVSTHHSCPGSIQTDAPNDVVWDIMRCYAKQNGGGNCREGTPGHFLLAQEPKLEADFTHVKGSALGSKSTGVAKFLPNPEAGWGPKARALGDYKRKNPDGTDMDPMDLKARQMANQNKRKKARQAKQDFTQFPCRKFKAGECKFGDECKYTHEKGEATMQQ